jgi:small subunit ribosomal protein S6
MFIVRPDVDEATLTSTRERVQAIVSEQGGEVEEVKDMGKRRLAYLIDNHREGYYTVTTFKSNADAVQEVERVLNINDNVMRFLTINLDQK